MQLVRFLGTSSLNSLRDTWWADSDSKKYEPTNVDVKKRERERDRKVGLCTINHSDRFITLIRCAARAYMHHAYAMQIARAQMIATSPVDAQERRHVLPRLTEQHGRVPAAFGF